MRTRVQRGVYIQIDRMVNSIISYQVPSKKTSWMHFVYDIHIVSIYNKSHFIQLSIF